MDLNVSRRDILRQALLGATALSLGACAGMPPPPRDIVLTRLIDAHAHIFNGADLPVRGFSSVVLQQSKAITALFAGLARTAVKATREIADLRSELGTGAATAVAEAGDVDILASYLESVADTRGRRAEAADPAGTVTVAATTSEAELRYQGLQELTRRYLPAAAPSVAAPAIARAPNARALAEMVLAGSDLPPIASNAPGQPSCDSGEDSFANLSTVFRWAVLLTRRRSTIADRLHEVFGAAAVPQFLTPALVDYSFWVDDFDTTAFAEQIEVNALLSRRANPRGYALHGYMCFDPWRHAHLKANGQPGGMMAWLRHAIGEATADGMLHAGRGFIGVKLYPPMGFRAYGNADLPDTAFPPNLRTLAASQGKSGGALLDEAMAELFTWCAAQDVPIMAHCSPSNFPHVAWAAPPPGMASADPTFWRRALQTWPSLRLNLAHSGGLATAACADATHSGGWLDEVYDLCAIYPNVYADVGDLTELFADGGQAAAGEIIQRLAAALTRNPAASAKILYGSDWIMQARLRNHQNYLSAMQKVLVPELAKVAGMPPDFADRFFWRNAQAFLGLSAGSKTMARLAPFYDSWNGLPALNRAVLDGFVAA